MKCSICGREIEKLKCPETGKVIWDKGNNAEPVNSGRCCRDCNEIVVIPARLKAYLHQHPKPHWEA